VAALRGAASRDLVTLLDHPGFAQEVVHKLLLQGTPDFDRLRRFYLEGEGDSDRWEALKPALQMFFDGIETRLLASEPFGPLLRDTRQLVALTGIEDGQQELIRLSRQQQALAARAAVTGEAHLTVALEQTTHLSEIAALLRQQLEQQRATQAADVPTGPALTDAERVYLRQLRSECDRLPLAGEARDLEASSGRGRASLARVYVELETQTPPSEGKILGRLGVPEEQWPGLRQQVKSGKDGLHALLGVHQIKDDHPLRPWVKDRQELRRAARNLSAVEALVEHRHLVLLGDPGSGKSTFVNHLAAALADRLLVTEGDEGALPLGAVLGLEGEETLFPARVILCQWSSRRWSGCAPRRGAVASALTPGARNSMPRTSIAKTAGWVGPRRCTCTQKGRARKVPSISAAMSGNGSWMQTRSILGRKSS